MARCSSELNNVASPIVDQLVTLGWLDAPDEKVRVLKVHSKTIDVLFINRTASRLLKEGATGEVNIEQIVDFHVLAPIKD